MATQVLILILFFLVAGCASSERMERMYAQRCLGCHGVWGRGDGPLAASLPVSVPDFRDTIRSKSVIQIRKVITQGKGIMPAFEPALAKPEIQDMVRMVRVLSQKGRSLEWWEKFEPLVWAHCSVPWEFVIGYEEPANREKPR